MSTHGAKDMIQPQGAFGEEIILKGKGRKINLASGNKVDKGFLNLDLAGKPDVFGDVRWLPFQAETFGQARAWHILEHIPREQLVGTMNEWWRVLKIKGLLDIEVPIVPSEDAWADPTHLSWFVPKTFDYFTKENYYDDHRRLYNIYPWKIVHRARGGANSVVRIILEKVPE